MIDAVVEPDALLVERVAALSDKAALAELYRRHGLSLYAIAYACLLDPDAADAAVRAAFRVAWQCAASFSALAGSAQRWLGDLTRDAARDQLRAWVAARDRPLSPARGVAAAPTPALLPIPLRAGARRSWIAAALIVPLLLL